MPRRAREGGRWPGHACLAAALLSAACAGPAARLGTSETARHCGASREGTPEEAAVRCAGEFLARNGYTTAEPDHDPARIAPESMEWVGGVDYVLAKRRDTLDPRATAVCTGCRYGNGFTVVFAYRDAARAGLGRVVTMGPAYDNLWVEYRDFDLRSATEANGCRVIAR